MLCDNLILEDDSMAIAHVHQALQEVKRLRQLIAAGKQFNGYSGLARTTGGVLALLAGLVMSAPFFPDSDTARIAGWGTLCALAVAINYSALFIWYLRNREESLKPIAEAFPSLLAAALISAALIYQGQLNLLFGTWMTLFGLVNLSSHSFLPDSIKPLGWFYITAGAFCFFWDGGVDFRNPWPMALVFCIGELAGGFIFYRNRLEMERSHE